MGFRSWTTAGLLAMLDQQVPELLDCIKQFAAALLDQYLPQQCAERTHIPPQRVVLRRIFRPGREFGEAGILVFRFPQQFGLAHEGRRKGIVDRINERAVWWARALPGDCRSQKGSEPNARVLRRKGRDASRGSPRFLTAQRTLVRNDKSLLYFGTSNL